MTTYSSVKLAVAEAAGVGGGTDAYTSVNDLPTTGNSEGDQAFVSGNNRLYIWNGSGWYNIALINNTPTINQVLDSDNDSDWTSYVLNPDGSTSTITIVATDPEEIPITYTTTTDTGFDGLATVSGDSSVFTITPLSEDSATETSGTITFRASDGINIASAIRTFTLSFSTFFDMQKNASFNSLQGKPQSAFASDGTFYNCQGYQSFTGATGNQIAIHRVADGIYDWTTILGNSVNNYNNGFDPAALCATDTNIFYNSKHTDIPFGSQRYNHFIGKLNISTGGLEDFAVVRDGGNSTNHTPQYYERSATSGYMLYCGTVGSYDVDVYMYKHPDNAVFQTGDTINQSDGSHFYKKITIDLSDISNYYLSGSSVVELSDGSIVVIITSAYDSSFNSFNLHAIKFNSDGTYNSRGYTNNTSGTKGYKHSGACVDDDDNIYIMTNEQSSTSNKTRMHLVKLNSSLVEQDRESFKLANATVNHTDNLGVVRGKLVHHDGYLYFVHRSNYGTQSYWTLVRVDTSDLSAEAYQYDYVTDANVWTVQQIVNGNTALMTSSGDLSTHSISSWPWTVSNSPNSSATPTSVSITSYGTSWSNWSWNTTTNNTSNFVTTTNLTPVNLYGSYPTTYGANSNYYNIIQTSSSLANPTVSII